MDFPPIAIVGRAAVLPGAPDIDAFHDVVDRGLDCVGPVPQGRWRLSVANAMGHGPDRTWCDRGGYIRGFDARFAEELGRDPFPFPAEKLAGLDPLFQLVLHTGRAALRDAGHEGSHAGVGAIFGNLSYPSATLSRYAEAVWSGAERPDPLNRFMSGMPAHLLAMVLGLGGPAFALDAACASSLYAMKLACDALHDGRADVMLAGAVNRADDLFIHTGFCALKAMSASGQSRPFHAEADGLLPAEGAGFVVLKRLEDAVRNGDRVRAVIRGIGLSNDGRGKGFLAPAVAGQVRAMAGAWRACGLEPRTVGMLECHATGTQVGDATEIQSMTEVFGQRGTPIGSLKSNLGHLITAAGVAGTLKVMHAMETGTRPATLHADVLNPALGDSPFRVLTRAEAWTTDGPRRAGVNAFGFGGNNAHLILEEPGAIALPSPRSAPRTVPVALVAIGTRVGDTADAAAFGHALQGGSGGSRTESITLGLKGLRFPPKDLGQVRAQQLLVLAAAREAIDTGPELPRDRTMVLVGMGCDPEVCRYGARWRVAETITGPRLDAVRDGIIAPLDAAGVVGNMPNIPANRLNSQFDLAGPSFALSAEELSGGVALDVALRALAHGEADAAVVGAVDLSHEPVHVEALAAVGAPRAPGDAAVVLVLERLDVAERAGHPVLAILEPPHGATLAPEPVERFGNAHAAAGLVRLAAAALLGETGTVETRSLTGFVHAVGIRPGTASLPSRPASSGPSLDFAAHPPAVPPFPSAPAAQESPPMQTLTPAPVLPRTTTDGAPVPLATAHAPASSSGTGLADASSAPRSTPRTPARTAPVSGHPADAVRRAQAALVAQHQAYLDQQTALHEQFLATRTRAMAVLGAAWGQPAAARPAFAPPAMAPAPAPAPVTPAPVAAAAPTRAPAASASAPVKVAPSVPTGPRAPIGPTFSREDLEHLASHQISDRFGPMFAIQDDFPRQVRMPEPPLLLADRVTGIDAEPGSMTTGTIWTETDVTPDAWYLHQGSMPAGVMIESGQADLLLISWLGADFQNRGERVYRLLGCELTYRNGLPQIGDTLSYDIHVDGHANQGDIRIFFFHYDCHIGHDVHLSVRHGQAGFFTDKELAESGGVLWTPEENLPEPARVDAPVVSTEVRSFSRAQVQQFAAGRAAECFGPGFELLHTHTRTPRIQEGKMTFLDEVTTFDPSGGPWGRGYLRAETAISSDDWFFDGHFKDDPCMPGTLMFEGCLQAMSFYLTAMGYTLDRDGWRFEPVPDVPYQLICRGQCTPDSRELIYEVFVSEVHDGPEPMMFADLMCTVDGRKAFHAKRVGLKLRPAWPLDQGHPVLDTHVETKPVATMQDGFPFDYKSLLACAWGRPSEAFGPQYGVFDHIKRVARLPGPPYHFLTRVTSTSAPFGGFKPGVKIVVEYDVPKDAWYFWENAHPTMPFAVLLEAALQPCGWLASYVGSALSTDVELFFRNLDGTGNLLVEILPTSGTLRTEVEITAVSASGGMIIEGFLVTCYIGDTAVYEMKTVFGFFPAVALANQLGMPPTEAERVAVQTHGDRVVDLRSRPEAYFGGKLRLPEPMLLMCDRITGWYPEGGAHGLGRVTGEKDVNPSEWFFKAHFFQDPVQPGSLGIENLIQILQWAAIEKGLANGMNNPHFEPLMLGRPLTWKYRGQVVPKNKTIYAELDITEAGEDDTGRYLVATGYLWADDLRIYQAVDLGVRVVDGPPADELGTPPATTDRDLGTSYRPGQQASLDPGTDAWLGDHRPTFTRPALPAMSMVDALIGASGQSVPVAVRDLAVHRWLTLDGATPIRTVPEQDTWVFEAWRTADNPALSRFEPVCTGRVTGVDAEPVRWEAVGGELQPDPYADGTLFHGPAFHYMTSWRLSEEGAQANLDPAAGTVPAGHTHQGLLDAITHGIPQNQLATWFPEVGEDAVSYPYQIPRLQIFRTPPTGPVTVQLRPLGVDGRFVRIGFQAASDAGLWAEGELVQIVLPKGPLGLAEASDRRAFLEDHAFREGVALSQPDGDGWVADPTTIKGSNWLPGTVEATYGTTDPAEIALADAIGQAAGVHPAFVNSDGTTVTQPLTRYPVEVTEVGGRFAARVTGPPSLNISRVRDWWATWFERDHWPVEDLYYGLIERFIGSVHVEDPAAFEDIAGRSTLYLANHQVAVESLLFSIIASGLTGVPTVTLAKAEHRHTWLGRMIAHCFSYPGVADPEVITFFDRNDKRSLPRIIQDLAAEMSGPGKSVMVHVEGTRSLRAGTPVELMSGAFIDMALATNSPIVPVRFSNALPTSELDQRLEFPVGFGRQDIHLGTPLLPEDLAALRYKDRKAVVLEALNSLPPADEQPSEPAEPVFHELVDLWKAGNPEVDDEHAVLAAVLGQVPDPHPEILDVLAGEATTDWGRELQRRLTEGL